MPEVIFNGPVGRLEGRYHPSNVERAPIALILHPNPQYGGTMNNKVVYKVFYAFANRGFSVLRFNFRGVGRSQGIYDSGVGEMSDAAAALDWLQATSPDAQQCWIAGFSFGAWVSLQLLMRRPEIDSFISVAPPANMYDFGFLAPCPSSGLVLHGNEDQLVPVPDVKKLVERLNSQTGLDAEHQQISGANHFFEGHLDTLTEHIDDFIEARFQPEPEQVES